MPLDPDNAAYLEQVAHRPQKPLAETTIEEFRAAMEALVPMGFTFEGVHEVVDEVVDGLPVRTYRPTAEVDTTVLWLHGGSFTRCGLTTHDTLYRYFANRSGAEVVAVDYSLAPDAQYPDQLEEIVGVTRWLADRRDWDGRRLVLAGESSGGALAAVLALIGRDRHQGGEAEPPPLFDGLLLVVPLLDHDSGTTSRHELNVGYLFTDEQFDWMFEQYAPDAAEDDPYVHPFRARSLSGLPPMMVVTAEYDPLHDEGHRFAERVRDAGGAAQEHCVRGVTHHALLLTGCIPAGAELIDRAAAWVRDQAS